MWMYRFSTWRIKARFNFWVWKTNLKELHYKFYSVPEWRLENIHQEITDFVDNYVEFEESDGHGEYSNRMFEALEAKTGEKVDRDLYEVIYRHNHFAPYAFVGQEYLRELYVDSVSLGELEIDLELCDAYSDMSPSEHDAYLRWCKENKHEVPNEYNCVYVSSDAHIGIYRKREGHQEEDAKVELGLMAIRGTD